MAKELKRILYVEDDPDIQEVARVALEEIGGFEVLIVGLGREALVHVGSFGPDMILLDVMMPDMDGVATFKALRLTEAARETPILFLTAKVQPDEVKGYLRLGAADVIFKPFDPMTVARSIRSIWDNIHG